MLAGLSRHDIVLLRQGEVTDTLSGGSDLLAVIGIASGRAFLDYLSMDDQRPFSTWLAASATHGSALNCRLEAPGGKRIRHVQIKALRLSGSQWLLCLIDATADAITRQTIRVQAEQHRWLARQLIEIQETERRHLARELHDEIGQQLAFLKMAISGAAACSGPASRQATIDQLDELMAQVRNLSLDLRPTALDDLGLSAALAAYASRTTEITGVRVIAHIPPEIPRLRHDIESTVFRIAQEAVTNAIKHSVSDSVDIECLVSANSLRLKVRDAGRGFLAESVLAAAYQGKSAGLFGMRERAALVGASLEVVSAPGQGTVIILNCPLIPAD
ncbi:MAG: sensor histidine kinase [Gammaproteobacteria bacterium]|nr:sensor histidine kinase [Gammaproteobacteria bacterium]